MRNYLSNATFAIASATVLAIGISTAQGATTTFVPDTLAEIQTNGDIIYQLNSSTATSVISDPSVEAPNELRATTTISAVDRVRYTHDLIGATFDPSTQGAIIDMDFAIEVNDPDIGNSDTAIAFGIEQGGNTYFYSEDGTSIFQFRNAGSTSFLAFDKDNLTAMDFDLFTGTSENGVTDGVNPDFTATGGNMQFIYGTVSATGGGTLTRNTDFRSSEIVVNFTAPPTPAPEPASFALAVMGVLGLGMRRRKRSRV